MSGWPRRLTNDCCWHNNSALSLQVRRAAVQTPDNNIEMQLLSNTLSFSRSFPLSQPLSTWSFLLTFLRYVIVYSFPLTFLSGHKPKHNNSIYNKIFYIENESQSVIKARLIDSAQVMHLTARWERTYEFVNLYNFKFSLLIQLTLEFIYQKENYRATK